MFGVVIPVGPGDRELGRLEALLSELKAHEREGDVELVVVDDGPVARGLAPAWPNARVIRTRIRESGPPDLYSAMVAGTLEAFSAVRVADPEFIVKLDTDAAIVRGFSESLRAAFQDSAVGVLGSYDRTSTGGSRDWSMWPPLIDVADRPFALRREGLRLHVTRRTRDQRQHIREQRIAAYANAPAGAHCLGGAYAVSASFLRSASLDWQPWIGSRLGEDVVVGLLASAAGLTMRSLTGPAEPFALAWRGLPGTPTDIAAGGHAIVHSVKGETEADERLVRDALQRATRAADAASE